jgi:hypothetical protein
MDIIRSREGFYDPTMVEALGKVLSGEIEYEIRSLTVDQLEPDMVFDEHVLSTSGAILVPKGKDLTMTMRNRLQAYVNTEGVMDEVREPIRMRVPVYRQENVQQRRGAAVFVGPPSGSDTSGG